MCKSFVFSLASVVFVLLFQDASSQSGELGPFSVFKEWTKIPYDTHCIYSTNGIVYRSSRNEISGIKIFRSRIYLSIPRQEGVPVTLAYIALHGGYTSPRLQPFPSWDFQDTRKCSLLQSVQGFEVDLQGRMWVLDNGSEKCSMKLILFDLNKPDFVQTGDDAKQKPGCKSSVTVIRTYDFPEEVVSQKRGCHLNDIVIDSEGWFAYITDSGMGDPGIVVYSFQLNKSWKIRDKTTMIGHLSDDIKGGSGNINGIALTPPSRQRMVYYSVLSNSTLYALPTSILKNRTASEKDVSAAVRKVGEKTGNSDGMVMDSAGTLYFGLENSHSVAKWSSKTGTIAKNETILAGGQSNFTWIDSFAFDLMGNLYFTTNHNPGSQEPTSKIYRGRVGAVRSYMYRNNLPFQ